MKIITSKKGTFAQITIYLPESCHDVVKAMAAKEDRTISKMCAHIIERHLAKEQLEKEQ